jgi:hypothetical protein
MRNRKFTALEGSQAVPARSLGEVSKVHPISCHEGTEGE